MREYCSTIEAAKYCRVTRFTIINWIEKGLIQAQKTAGGHRRILFCDLVKFMHEYKMDVADINLHYPATAFKWCWEYNRENGKEHECRECIVFKTGTKRCFSLREETNHKKIFCKKECADCSYYKNFRDESVS